MDWQKFFRLQVGEAVAADPSEAFGGVEPIIELSETVMPRRILLSRHRDGSDLMVALLEDRAARAFTLRGRYRAPSGAKSVAPKVRWLPAEAGGVPRTLSEIVASTEAAARAHGAEVTRLEFPATAGFEEVIERFVASGAFDVLRGDEKKQEIRRLS